MLIKRALNFSINIGQILPKNKADLHSHEYLHILINLIIDFSKLISVLLNSLKSFEG